MHARFVKKREERSIRLDMNLSRLLEEDKLNFIFPRNVHACVVTVAS